MHTCSPTGYGIAPPYDPLHPVKDLEFGDSSGGPYPGVSTESHVKAKLRLLSICVLLILFDDGFHLQLVRSYVLRCLLRLS